jgi:hypothetical protein
LLPDGKIYVVYYADSRNLRQPDIKSLVLNVAHPVTTPSSALHIVSQLDPGRATRNLNIAAARYSLDFGFRSNEIAAGSQFSVVLEGTDPSGVSLALVNWELPSVHSSDPTSVSGLFADNQFVPVSNSFIYGQTYRIRTIVDEAQQQQEGQVLDQFGAILSTSGTHPLAQGSAHASTIMIGNNSNLRATDTLLDFIFVRQNATMEPQITISRLH